jgi:probable phosphoglycerate mutase
MLSSHEVDLSGLCSCSKNRLLFLRHGLSKANQLGLIVSQPENALHDYGLVEEGRQQVQESARGIAKNIGPIAAVYASDFLRTRQTAVAFVETLGGDIPIRLSKDLRERSFGLLELQADDHYRRAWAWDMALATRKPSVPDQFMDIETPQNVAARMLKAIRLIDRDHQGETVLLVSHGDPLDMLFSALQGRHPGLHRDSPFGQAEFRMLDISQRLTTNRTTCPQAPGCGHGLFNISDD